MCYEDDPKYNLVVTLFLFVWFLNVAGFCLFLKHLDRKAEDFEQNVNEGKEIRLSENEKPCEAFIPKLVADGHCLKKVDTISEPYFFILSPYK